jgi:CheY-like chemotaxis protein
VAAAIPSPRTQRRLQGAKILWVDDRPDNNRFERQTLEALGIDVDLSTSTEDALQKVRQRSYDLLISDMGRPPDARAGYTLLDQLRQSGYQTPFIIYAGSRTPEHIREAREHGAITTTNSPQELVTIVTNVLTTR